jgi:hypothetical protein
MNIYHTQHKKQFHILPAKTENGKVITVVSNFSIISSANIIQSQLV